MDHSKYMGGVDLRQRLQLVWQAMPDARLTVDDYVVQGNTFACRWRIEGTHEGQIWSVPPSGKRVALRGISLAYVQDGKATEYWEFPDVPGLIQQLEAAT
jgi:predicted ester cyclase